MEDNIFWVIVILIVSIVIMLISSGERNTRKSHNQVECDHDWEFDGENGSTSGMFFRCKKCGKAKYIPYKELMALPEEEYKYWVTRQPTIDEKYRRETKKNTEK